ncbi:hypothetical protein [Dishui Lake large algae virus 1]|nr:hypothetical protein [Dishui Lake large algae virus 1]
MDTDELVPLFETGSPVAFVRRLYKADMEMVYIFVGNETRVSAEIKEHIKSAEKDSSYWDAALASYTGRSTRPSGTIKFVFDTLWPDDERSYALSKIIMNIRQLERNDVSNVIPFAWNSQGIMLFSWPTLDIEPTAINPWKRPFDVIEKQPVYKPYDIIGTDDISIILYDDLKDAGLTPEQIHMYFPDMSTARRVMPSKQVKGTEEYLSSIWNTKTPNIRSVVSRIKGVTYEASFDPTATRDMLPLLFEGQKATKNMPLIQWVDDVTRVMYKLYKKHNIRSSDLKKWLDRYNIPSKPSIVMYNVWKRSATYTRTHIQEDGKVGITYNIDNTDKSFGTLAEIEGHARKAVSSIAALLGIPSLDIKLVDVSYDLNVSISVVGVDEEQLISSISDGICRAIPLFHVAQVYTERRRKTMIYKRASGLDYRFSLSEAVQSMLDCGMYEDEIRSHLSKMGYEKHHIDEARDEIRLAQEEGRYVRPSINIDTADVTVVTYNQIDGTMHMGVRHAADVVEAKRALKWLTCVAFYAINTMRSEAEKYEVLPIEIVPVPTPAHVSAPSSSKSVEEKETTKERESRSATSSEFEFSGGAKPVKKVGDGFLLERLQNADSAIFANKKANYARTCQQHRQPLFMTQDEWEQSKTKVANSILYRNNHYSCPSIWCREKGVVMTPEELKNNNGKCPGTEEKPVILWDNPADRFVGFNKKVVMDNGRSVYSPCCFGSDKFKDPDALTGKDYEDLVVYGSDGMPIDLGIKKKTGKTGKTGKTEKKESGEEAEEAEEAEEVHKEEKRKLVAKEETYIFKQDEPVPEKGRYGSVPMALYRLFFPEYAEQGNNISTQPTIIRHGIGLHHEDSLMGSIAYALGLETKDELIEEIVKVLDPLTFISLEGGAVLSAFTMDGLPQISYEAWLEWISHYPDYMALVGVNNEHSSTDELVQREMKVYDAYLRFVHHLRSNDEKNVRILYSILARLGVFLMVWERDKTTDAVSLLCPYFVGYDGLKDLVKKFKNRHIMLLYHGSYKYPYYEPLEIRTLNKPAIREIPLDEYPMAQEVSMKCPVAYHKTDMETVEKLRGLMFWTSGIFEFSSKQYMPKVIVISSDLRIEGVITHGKIWIQLPRPSVEILPRLVDMLASMRLKPEVRYHEDIDTKAISSQFSVFNRNEYDMWRNKCQSIGFVVTDKIPPPPPVVPVVSIMPHSYEAEFTKTGREMKQWRDLQLRIARYLLYQYDNKVSKHIGKSSREFIDAIMDIVLKDLWEKEIGKVSFVIRKKIKTAVEEMPLIYGKDSLQKWIHTISLSPYRFYDGTVYTSDSDKDVWMFSQLAVEAGLPKDVVVPTAAMKPNENSVPEVDDVTPIEVSEKKEQPPSNLPIMAMTEEVSIKEMPSKWRKTSMKLMKIKRYRQECIEDLFRWMAVRSGSPFTWGDVRQTVFVQMAGYIRLPRKAFDEALGSLVQEPTFKKAWIQALGLNKTIRDEELVNSMWDERSVLLDKLKDISEIDPTPIWPMDMDLKVVSQLLDMFVLIIFRKPYNVSKKEHDKSEIEKLTLSSVLYSNRYTTMDRPLVMLYREKDGDKGDKPNIYSLIVSGQNSFYYTSASDASVDIQAIINAHREKYRV